MMMGAFSALPNEYGQDADTSIAETVGIVLLFVAPPMLGVLFARRPLVFFGTILMGVLFFEVLGWRTMQDNPDLGIGIMFSGLPMAVTVCGMRSHLREISGSSLERLREVSDSRAFTMLGLVVLAVMCAGAAGIYAPGLIVLLVCGGFLLICLGMFTGGVTLIFGIPVMLVGIFGMASTFIMCEVLGMPIPSFELIDALKFLGW